MTRFLFIRHGESMANREGLFVGHTDALLHENGINQAKLTAKFILENYKVDKIYSSDLKRAYETALCIAKELGIDVESNENLRELYAGKWEGAKFDLLSTLYPEEFGIWFNDISKSRCPDGESIEELCDRFVSELETIADRNDGKTVAIISHATPIRVIVSIAQTGGIDMMQAIPWVSNASVTEIDYQDKKWQIKKLSQDTHLSEIKTELPSNV